MPECKCRIETTSLGPEGCFAYTIEKCGLCKAAPVLYEACEAASLAFSKPGRLCEQLNAAMFAARER